MKEIEHQIQPTGVSCVSTCVAMLAGVPAEEVIKRFHMKYYVERSIRISDMLDHYDISYAQVLSGCEPRMDAGYIYLLSVPSLNLRGQLHEIIVDYREGVAPKCYDPAKGLGGRSYYVLTPAEVDEDENGLAFQLLTWVVDFVIEGE